MGGFGARGYTLIEMLVVVALIALLAGVAVLRMRGGEPAKLALGEAQRLVALLELWRDEAVETGEPRGVQFDARGWRAFAPDDSARWLPLAGAPAVWRLPEVLVLTLSVDGRGQSLPGGSTAGAQPQIVFFGDGSATRFLVGIGTPAGEAWAIVHGDALGHLRAEALR